MKERTKNILAGLALGTFSFYLAISLVSVICYYTNYHNNYFFWITSLMFGITFVYKFGPFIEKFMEFKKNEPSTMG